MDIGTLIGTLALIGAVVFAGHQGFQALYSPEAIALVVVGTVAWALVSYPLKTVAGIGRLYKTTFFNKTSDPHVLIRKMVAYAETARREGILALRPRTGPKAVLDRESVVSKMRASFSAV